MARKVTGKKAGPQNVSLRSCFRVGKEDHYAAHFPRQFVPRGNNRRRGAEKHSGEVGEEGVLQIREEGEDGSEVKTKSTSSGGFQKEVETGFEEKGDKSSEPQLFSK